MRALVLVDLDNVGDWLQAGVERLQVRKGPKSRAEADEALVVFGLNCESSGRCARSGLSTWIDFDRLAARIVSWLEGYARLAGVEVALTLTAPEAVDHAIVGLVRTSPGKAEEDRIRRLWLISSDKGIRERIESCTSIQKKYWTFTKEAPAGTAVGISSATRRNSLWAWDVRGFRRGTRHVAVLAGQPIDPPLSPSVFIDSDGLAGWASTQKLQVHGTLHQIAKRVDREPSLLTQVGMTRSGRVLVAAGVDRLERVMRGEEGVLGPCGSGDGLEVSGLDHFEKPTLRKMRVTEVKPSSLGPGAVRLYGTIDGESKNLTARTVLPPAIVRDGLSCLDVTPVYGGARLQDRALLSACSKSKNVRQHDHLLASFVREKRSTICEVDLQEKGAWWCAAGTLFGRYGSALLAQSKLIFPQSCSSWIGKSGVWNVACVSRVVRSPAGAELILVSPLEAGSEVRVVKDLDGKRERIGPAASTGRKTRCALLCSGICLKAGAVVGCSPIQMADSYNLMEKLGIDKQAARVLRALPLIVPAGWAQSKQEPGR